MSQAVISNSQHTQSQTKTVDSSNTPGATPAPNGSMPIADRDSLRRQLYDRATVKASSGEELGSLKEKVVSFVNSAFDDSNLRGVSREKLHQTFTAQLDHLAQERNLTPGQKEMLRQEFLKVETERSTQRAAAINRAIADLGRRDNEHVFEQEHMKERVTKAYEELRKVAGNSTPTSEWREITARFESVRENDRRALMMKEIAALGKSSVELGTSPDENTIKQRLIEIRKRYADISVKNPEELASTFRSAYEQEYDSKVAQKGFFERKYYQARRFFNSCGTWLSDSLESASSIGESFKNTISEVTSAGVGIGKVARDLAVLGAEKAYSAGAAAGAFAKTVVTDPATAAAQVTAAVSQAARVTTESAGWLANKVTSAGSAVANGLSYVGNKTLELGALVAKGDLRAAGAIVAGGFQASLSFAKGMCDSLGLSHMASGVSHLVMAQVDLYRDAYKVVTGQGTLKELVSNYANHMAGTVDGLKGAAICLGEVSGITDLCLAGKHSVQALAAYGRGDTAAALAHLGQASIHGACAAMSVGAIGAVVVTGGGAALALGPVALGRATLQQAGKQILQVAAKEFLEVGAKQIGQTAVQRMGAEAVQVVAREMGSTALNEIRDSAIKQLGTGATAEAQQALVEKLALQTLLKREGSGIALQGAETLSKQVEVSGARALAKENVEAVMRDVGETRTADLLSKLKLTDAVDELTLGMLKDVSTKRTSTAAKELAETIGVSQKEATAMVKEMKSALSRGKSDEAMKQILTDGISAEVKKVVEQSSKESFQTTFKRSLTGQVDEPWAKVLHEGVEREAKRVGKSVDSYADELVESGWKGAREGMEKATHSAVQEGVESAFKAFRKSNSRLNSPGGAANTSLSSHEKTDSDGPGSAESTRDKIDPSAVNRGGERAITQTITRELGAGQSERVNMVYDPSTKDWRVVSSERISTGTPEGKN